MIDDETTSDGSIDDLETGDVWPRHYRGYQFSVNQTGDVWWQAYNGTDRLYLDSPPEDFIDQVHAVKRNGGAVRVTEGGRAISLVETSSTGGDSEWETIYIGRVNLSGNLQPKDEPEHAVELNPAGLDPGDLWTSVYDGAKYSFSGGRFWWENGQTKLRHSFAESLPNEIETELKRLRPQGGSFQITPEGSVLTQIPTAKSPADVREQFRDLPREIKRILQLRRDRGNVDMLPVYVGHLDRAERPIEVEEPIRLTDPLSEQEEASLEAWAASMGSYDESDLDENDHQFGDNQ